MKMNSIILLVVQATWLLTQATGYAGTEMEESKFLDRFVPAMVMATEKDRTSVARYVPVLLDRKSQTLMLEYLDRHRPPMTLRHHEGMALFSYQGLFGYCGFDGDIIINSQYMLASNFRGGVARVKARSNGMWGYIRRDGTFQIDPIFSMSYDFNCGIAAAAIPKELPKDPDVENSNPFNQGKNDIVNVKYHESLWGIVDKNGAWLIKPQFVSASNVRSGIRVVTQSGGTKTITPQELFGHENVPCSENKPQSNGNEN